MASISLPWNTVNTLVGDFVVKNLQDEWYRGNAFLSRQRERVKHFSGGRSIQVPLVWKPNNRGQWFSGADIIDTTIIDPVTMATFYPKSAAIPIVVTWEDEKQVQGPSMVKDLVETLGGIARTSIENLIGTDIFNDGTDAKRMTGLQYSLRPFTTPAPGTCPSQTYGGITRAGLYGGSTATNGYWIHQGDNTAYSDAASGNFDPADPVKVMNVLGKMWAGIMWASGKQPTMILSNVGGFSVYHMAIAKNERWVKPQQDTKLADDGFENLKYKRAVWVVDYQAPRDANKVESIYFINEDTVRLYVHEDADFAFEPFRKPHNQMARVAFILWRGELIVVEPRANGVISAVTCATCS